MTAAGWTLHHGDCIAGMRGLADKSVDVCLTDPPYDEHTHSAGRRGATGFREKQSSAKATFSRSRSLGFDALTAEQMNAVAEQLSRVVKRWSLIFCSLEMISAWKAAAILHGLEYVRTCLWHKLGSTPQFTGDRPAVAAEAIVVCHPPGRKRWNGGGKHGYYAFPIVLNRGNGIETRCHTTQKPLPLATALLEDFSDPGELVLDGFAGSGTFGVAANHLGRRFIGWERASCECCSLAAEWDCSWSDKGARKAFLCDAHRSLIAELPDFQSHRDNMYQIARRRLSGDEAKPRAEQPSLFDLGAR